MDALDVPVASIGLDDLGCHEQFGDALEEVLVEVGFLANAVDVGAIREPAVFGGNAAGAEHRCYGAIPMAAVGRRLGGNVVLPELSDRDSVLLLHELFKRCW